MAGFRMVCGCGLRFTELGLAQAHLEQVHGSPLAARSGARPVTVPGGVPAASPGTGSPVAPVAPWGVSAAGAAGSVVVVDGDPTPPFGVLRPGLGEARIGLVGA